MNASALSAVQHIRRMRGGSQPQLMRASDGGFYIVKFQNNPQHVRVLANEFLATRLGLWLGLPTGRVNSSAMFRSGFSLDGMRIAHFTLRSSSTS